MWSIATRVQRRELPASNLRQLFAMWADMQSTGEAPNPSALSAVMIAYNQLRCFHVTLQLRRAFAEVDLRPQGHRALLIAASEAADVGAAVDAMKVLEADGVQLGRREYESLLLAALRAEDSETVDAALGALDQLPGRTSGRVHETLLQQCLAKKQYPRAAGALRWLLTDVRSLLKEDPAAMQQPRNRNFALVTRRVLEHTIEVDQEQLACAALGALALSGRGMAQGELLGRLAAAAARGQVQLADALIQQHCAVSLLQEHLSDSLPVVDLTEEGGVHEAPYEGGPTDPLEGGAAAAPASNTPAPPSAPVSLFSLPSDTDAGQEDEEEGGYTPRAAAGARGGLFSSLGGASRIPTQARADSGAHAFTGTSGDALEPPQEKAPVGPPVYTSQLSTHPLTPAMGGAMLRAALVARDWHSAYAVLGRAQQLQLPLPRAAVDDAATLLAATLQLSTGTERAYLGERVREAFEAGVVSDLVPYGTHGHNVLLAVAARSDRHQRSRDASFVFQLAQSLFHLDSVASTPPASDTKGGFLAGSDASVLQEGGSDQRSAGGGGHSTRRPDANLTTFELMALGCSEPMTVLEAGEDGGHAALQVLEHALTAGAVPSAELYAQVALAQAAAGDGDTTLQILDRAAASGEPVRGRAVERIARMLARHGQVAAAETALHSMSHVGMAPPPALLGYLEAHRAGEAQLYDTPAPAMREPEWAPAGAW